MKQLFKYGLCLLLSLAFAWGCFAGTDHLRAKDQKLPLFSITESKAYDGGTICYECLGYQVIHYNQLPENGGRTDIEFQLSPMSAFTFHVLIDPLLDHICYWLWNLSIPVLITMVIHRINRNLLFWSPFFTACALASFLLVDVMVSGADKFDFLDPGGWFDLIFILLFDHCLCLVLRSRNRERQSKRLSK